MTPVSVASGEIVPALTVAADRVRAYLRNTRAENTYKPSQKVIARLIRAGVPAAEACESVEELHLLDN